MQPRFTKDFLSACRRLGLHTLLETCGCGETAALLDIAELCDMLFFDVKLMDPEKHRYWTGADNRVILKNLRLLCARGFAERITVRTPCIPGVNDTPEEIRAIARFIHGLGVSRMQLLPYNPMSGEKYKWISADFALDGCVPRDKSHYAALNQLAAQEGLAVLHE